MERLGLLIATIVVLSCSSDAEMTTEMGEEPINFQFQDGFETPSDDFMLLFPGDGSRWSTTQIISPNNAVNTLSLSTTQASEGNQSLVIESRQSNEILSKVDIEKGGFTAPENSIVVIEADFYIASDAIIENLFLMDLECCSCWDPEVDADPSVDGDNKCPGVRLMMSGGNDYLAIERGKIAGTTLTQSAIQFPRREWTTIRWEMHLSPGEGGQNQLYINDELALTELGMNLPNSEVFKNVFAENDIEFELQQPVAYERIQVGATANPDAEDLIIYVDDFSISIIQD